MLSMVIEDQIYLGFGRKQGPIYEYFKDFWKYDIHSNTCLSVSSPVSIASGRSTSFILGRKAYIIGLGTSGSSWGSGADVWEFNSAEGSWNQKNDFPGIINGEAATQSNDHGLVVVNNQSDGYSKVYEYDPGKDLWIPRQSLQPAKNFRHFIFAHYRSGKLYFGTDQLWVMDFD